MQRRQKIVVASTTAVLVLAVFGGLAAANLATSHQDSGSLNGKGSSSTQAGGHSTGSQTLASEEGSILMSLPTGWKTLEGDGISLALPDTWIGGAPDKMNSEIGRVFASDPSGLAQAEALLARPGMEFMGFGQLLQGQPGGIVMAYRQQFPEDQALQQLAYAAAAGLPDPQVTFDSVGPNRVVCGLTYRDSQVTSTYRDARLVLIRAGDEVHGVMYTALDSLSLQLELMFDTSVATIVIQQPVATSTTLRSL